MVKEIESVSPVVVQRQLLKDVLLQLAGEEHADIREQITAILNGKGVKDSECTPEMQDQAIAALKQEFDTGGMEEDGFILKKGGYRVQKGMDFQACETSLRDPKNTAAVRSVYEMHMAGSKPALVCSEHGRFCIAETFDQTLSDRANCVYDKEAEAQVGSHRCNGNAVDQAQKMGVPLMDSDIAGKHFIRLPGSEYCFDYLQANKKQRESGCAPSLFRDVGRAVVDLNDADFHCGHRGWRGALWVQF